MHVGPGRVPASLAAVRSSLTGSGLVNLLISQPLSDLGRCLHVKHCIRKHKHISRCKVEND